MILGVDVGGTFTDFAGWDGERLHTAKVTTTPDQSDGVIEGSSRLGGESAELLHGTTVATNALLEKKGAVTALITDPGFADVIEIGRQDRPALYDPFIDRPEPLIPRRLRMAAPEAGDTPAIEALIERIAAEGVGAVAVSLLHSYRDHSREIELGAALTDRGFHAFSLSSRVAPEFREYERTSTTVLNAYLLPVVSAYLERLTTAFTGETSVMRSSGGLVSAAEAARLPASILLSGPAGGVMAASALGEASGLPRIDRFRHGWHVVGCLSCRGGQAGSRIRAKRGGLPLSLPGSGGPHRRCGGRQHRLGGPGRVSTSGTTQRRRTPRACGLRTRRPTADGHRRQPRPGTPRRRWKARWRCPAGFLSG